MNEIQYQLEPNLTASEFVDILNKSTLGQRRPVDQPEVIEGMLKNADVIATARDVGGKLVGIARSITDFHYCTYLSDLAVDADFQCKGIGKKLIAFSHEAAGTSTTLILLAAPAATEYYPRIGMQKHSSCWLSPPTPEPQT